LVEIDISLRLFTVKRKFTELLTLAIFVVFVATVLLTVLRFVLTFVTFVLTAARRLLSAFMFVLTAVTFVLTPARRLLTALRPVLTVVTFVLTPARRLLTALTLVLTVVTFVLTALRRLLSVVTLVPIVVTVVLVVASKLLSVLKFRFTTFCPVLTAKIRLVLLIIADDKPTSVPLLIAPAKSVPVITAVPALIEFAFNVFKKAIPALIEL